MRIAILTFDGFNEIDSFVALYMLGRVKRAGWQAQIAAPAPEVTSMNGVRIAAQQPLEYANEADAVLFGSGNKTRQIVADGAELARLQLDPSRQLIGSQCSGALMLAKLGLLRSSSACSDQFTAPLLAEAGVKVLPGAFNVEGNVATAGGCLSSHYLAAWVISRLIDVDAAVDALKYVVPVGQEADYIDRALATINARQPADASAD